MTTMTDAEQLMLELMNRARLDPAGEAARYGIDLNKDLPAGTISAAAKQPLAPNDLLRQASRGHSQWMLDNDVFSHTGAGGSDPGTRMKAAGYAFAGSWTWGENIAWNGTTGTLDLEASIYGQHEGLFRSAGHRTNTLNASFREIGAGTVTGDFTTQGKTYHAAMTTLDFARSGAASFITGVVYSDTDRDAFYGMGEGRGGVGVSAHASAGGASSFDTSASSGGYGVAVAGTTGNFDVTFAGGGLASSVTVTVALAALNAKVDLVDGVTLRTSVDATLGAGAKNLVLLGIDGIDATGNASANTLNGNSGANLLSGYGGADTLYGAAGNDILSGGTGADRMLGGGGRDTYLVGQPGDVVVEEQGKGIDTIKSSITRVLPANVENLTLTGTAATDGAGNALANVILGSRGDNALDGMGGSDTLTGGAGADSFVFSAAPGTANIDRITDFSVSADTIVLDDAVFAAAGAPGVLAAAAFCAGAAALDASDRIIHDPATGSLFYDSDGNGAHAAIAFAMLPAGLALTPADFLIA